MNALFCLSSFYRFNNPGEDLNNQCKAANNASDNYIQNNNSDSACKIKSMWHEPKEHTPNSEGKSNADP